MRLTRDQELGQGARRLLKKVVPMPSALVPESTLLSAVRGTSDEVFRSLIEAARAFEAAAEALYERAVRDPLTQLYNRRYLDERLAHEFARAERQRSPIAVLAIDLDFFKEFNMFNGKRNHLAGDALLERFGAFLNRQVRSGDLAFRRGGDEFVFVCPGVSARTARRRAEDIQRGIRRLRVRHNGRVLKPCTVSIGVASFPAHGRTPDAVLEAADAALHEAKTKGRSRVAITA
jgi:diguanylate cyclase (GGDEF)-like protein